MEWMVEILSLSDWRVLRVSHHVSSVSQRPGGSLQLLPDLHQTVEELQAETQQEAADPRPQTGLIVIVIVFVLVLLDPHLPLPT